MKLRTFALCVVVLAMAIPTFAASPMKPGKWQTTIQMEMPSMPGMKMPPVSTTQCITKEQAEKPEPPKEKKDDDCKVGDYKIDGNTVTWTISCEKQNVTGEGTMTFSGDSYAGSSRMKIGEMEMTQKLTGKRVGDCDEK